MTFDKRGASYDDVADALEELAEHDDDGDFDEYRGERRLIYTRDAMSITFDFEAGEVEFLVSGQSNLELIDTTRTVSLGWHNPSPMLAAAAPAALPDRTADAATTRAGGSRNKQDRRG